jgi:hypothetical protein
MKKILLALCLLVLLSSGGALAATYSAVCSSPSCVPFNSSNSYVAQLAVNTAAANSAPVGSTIVIEYFPHPINNCEERLLEWVVNHVPTLNSTHLTFDEGYCDVAGM